MQSLKVYMNELLDYAGLYPPAQLSLEESLKNYSEYLLHEYEDMLGKFVLPVNKIEETILLLNTHNYLSKIGKRKASFSIILSACKSFNDFPNILQKDFQSIQEFSKLFESSLEILSIEFLPPEDILAANSNKIIDVYLSILFENFRAHNKKIDFYCEIPLNDNFDKNIREISEYNRSNLNFQVLVKLRTGGVKKEQIPSAQEIAHALSLCAKYKIPVKATAGLHVPVPNFNPDVGTILHGFLNVFSSMMLAYQELATEKEIEDILSNYNYENFKFSKTGLEIGKFSLSNYEIENLRKKYIKSFGSCSFLEPIDHLIEHKILT
ncbi:hypothetical protein [Fluviispira multicolorata]|uniref:Uncharacterized protein n=1 Tax=Fluviispira multicolorata TaxID=2654512 RepID=A0A833N2T0_9BACT|nr:hypothetical protein [Fluviispira multicolorata]KAB8028591.1 hypothetical protein GCL57_12800 [Fluviispira multicolorata]